MSTVLSVIGYVLLGILFILLMALLLPLSARLCLQKGELTADMRALFVPIRLYPTEPKPQKKPSGDKKPSASEGSSLKKRVEAFMEQLKEQGVSAVLHYAKELVKLTAGTFGSVCRAVYVDKLKLDILIGTPSAADTAIAVGEVSAVLYPAVTALQGVFHIRGREVTVRPDFLAEEPVLTMDIAVHVTPLRLLWTALIAYLKFVRINKRFTQVDKEEKEDGELQSDGE